MNAFVLKSFFCIALVLAYVNTGIAHSGSEHSKDIGIVLGLRDAGGEPITGKRKEINDAIGQEIAFLIDTQAKKLYKELNSIIKKELQEDVFFSVLPDAAKKKDGYFLNHLKNNKKYLDKHDDYKNLFWVAEHLNWISLRMTRLPFYSDSDIKDISDEIYSKRNNYTPKSSHKLMKSFLFQKNEQITNIIDQHERFQPQVLKYQLDRWEKDQRFFNWGHYGHRIFFHWGYNLKRCRDYSPMREKVQESMTFIKENLAPEKTAETSKIESKLYDHTDKVWLENKKNVIRKVKKKIEYINEVDVSDEKVEVILTIAYNVHILGDYSDTVLEPLVSIDQICKDLINCLEKLSLNKNGRRYLVVVENAINSTAQKTMTSDRQKAEELLNVLKREIPKLLKDSEDRKVLVGPVI